jgi:flagellar hook-basal body complex protein FliE
MNNFTVGNANRWMEAGGTRDSKSMEIQGGSGPLSTPSSGSAGDVQKSFSDTLKDAIGTVNDIQLKADKGAQDLATGRTDNIADVMLTTEKADIALRLMVQVRNKMIDAYQEIMKMQV